MTFNINFFYTVNWFRKQKHILTIITHTKRYNKSWLIITSCICRKFLISYLLIMFQSKLVWSVFLPIYNCVLVVFTYFIYIFLLVSIFIKLTYFGYYFQKSTQIVYTIFHVFILLSFLRKYFCNTSSFWLFFLKWVHGFLNKNTSEYFEYNFNHQILPFYNICFCNEYVYRSGATFNIDYCMKLMFIHWKYVVSINILTGTTLRVQDKKTIVAKNWKLI